MFSFAFFFFWERSGTFIILKILDATVGLRPKPEAEMQGIDITEHGEEGYGDEFAEGMSFTSK
ncbi:ammonium transporter [Cyanobacteria bacterium FACHB-472]|nr:ammonium transporter [Cyanobacteria bacterium FACHB-472]